MNNRGKRSITLAVNTPAGVEALPAVVRTADVFLTDMPAHRLVRYGLEPARLLEENPRLVVVRVSGYGSRGPDAARPGYDVTAFFARGGMAESMTPPDGDAPRPPTGPGDHATGLAAEAAVLLGLRTVDQTGEVQVVDTSLFATGVWAMATMLVVHPYRRSPTLPPFPHRRDQRPQQPLPHRGRPLVVPDHAGRSDVADPLPGARYGGPDRR